MEEGVEGETIVIGIHYMELKADITPLLVGLNVTIT